MEALRDVVPQISKGGQAQKVEGCPSCFYPATDGSWRALANQVVGPSVEVLQVGLLERARRKEFVGPLGCDGKKRRPCFCSSQSFGWRDVGGKCPLECNFSIIQWYSFCFFRGKNLMKL